MTPRHRVERAYNLVHWTEMPEGGHFAALEKSDRLLADIRAFFRHVRYRGDDAETELSTPSEGGRACYRARRDLSSR